MINAGLYEIHLSAMHRIHWSRIWMGVIEIVLRLVRGVGNLNRLRCSGQSKKEESKARDIFVCKCFLTRTKKLWKVHLILKAILCC